MIGYKRPPIVEAALELRYETPIDLSDAKKAGKRALPDYVFSDPEIEINVNNDAVHGVSMHQSETGVRLSSLDRADISIFRKSSYVTSRLAPYSGWEAFRGRAQRDWLIIQKIAKPRVGRVGLRYINRIDFAGHMGEPVAGARYLNVWPHLPEVEGDSDVFHYALQLVKNLEEDDLVLTLNSSTAVSPVPEHQALALDIDLSREPAPKSDIEMWVMIDRMRRVKNALFESFITDEARDLFRRG